MALTPGGVPYVEPGDAVSDYPTVSQALALKVDALAMPIGMIVPFAAGPAPDNWLLCDGNTGHRRADYPELYALMQSGGFPYGGSSATETFGTPNLVGRVPLGLGGGFGLGVTGGTPDAMLITHDHDWSSGNQETGAAGYHNHGGHTQDNGAHHHAYYKSTSSRDKFKYASSGENGATTHRVHKHVATSEIGGHGHGIPADGTHTHRFNIGGKTTQTGSGDGKNANYQPYITLNFIILASKAY